MNEKLVMPSGENVSTSAALDYVKDGELYVNAGARSVCVTGQGDLAELPQDYPPGSVAFTAGFKKIWQLGADGVWVDLLESGGGT